MKGYRTPIEKLKSDYARMLRDRRMLAKRRAEPGYTEPKHRIPDNSEPWLEHPPRSVAECWFISESVTKHVAEWKRSAMPQDS